jgi:hypothetical protein
VPGPEPRVDVPRERCGPSPPTHPQPANSAIWAEKSSPVLLGTQTGETRVDQETLAVRVRMARSWEMKGNL